HMLISVLTFISLFFYNYTTTTEIYTLSLHDALPISIGCGTCSSDPWGSRPDRRCRNRNCAKASRMVSAHPGNRSRSIRTRRPPIDRKSTRLNSSHVSISYAVFCLKKKKKKTCWPNEK